LGKGLLAILLVGKKFFVVIGVAVAAFVRRLMGRKAADPATVAAPPGEPPPEPARANRPGKWLGIGAIALLALKKLPLLLVPLKFLKLGKFWLTAVSM